MSDAVATALIVAVPTIIPAIVAAVVALKNLKHVQTLRTDMTRFNAMERKVNIIYQWFLRQLENKTLSADEIKHFFGDDVDK